MTYIIFFRGLPGVGKSTIARNLATQLKIPVIDYDDLKGALVPFLEMPNLAKASYSSVINILESNTKIGLNCIFDSHGYYVETFDKCIELVGINNVILVECVCSNELDWKNHIEIRKLYSKPSQIHDLTLIKDSKSKMEDLFPKHKIFLDTIKDVDFNTRLIIKFLLENKFIHKMH